MATSKLTQLAQQFSDAQLKVMSSDSLTWMKKKIAEIRSPAFIAAQMNNEKFRRTNRITPGKLFCFYYDPKGKTDLPYYDIFPMTLVLEQYPDGFLGLNLHYLPYNYRVAFLKKLMDYAVLDKENEVQRLRITYDILSVSKRLKEFKPCIKKYLYGHVKSHILAIQPEEYQIAALLPLQRFQKANSGEVWSESIQKIG
jgi:hypothetical protein